MNRTLRYDEEARELRLVLADYWKGEHERMEYRVVDENGHKLHGWRNEYWNGQTAYWDGNRYYVKLDGLYSAPIFFTTEQQAVVSTKATCPRFTNRRRHCALCKAMKKAS